MSSVVIQVGQCGNQVGYELFSRLYYEANSSLHISFREKCFKQFFTKVSSSGLRIANAVLIDMESKVINNCLSEAGNGWCYSPSAGVRSRQGSGNNWANGYLCYGELMKDEIEGAIRSIANLIPDISTVLILMSSAGGTGSGLGCRVTEMVKDIIPGALILNQVVLPFSKGEVAVQGYNTILTLSSLYQHSDSILLLHNDSYQKLWKRLSSGIKELGDHGMSFGGINKLMSSHLSGIILPSNTISRDSDDQRCDLTADRVIEELVPSPQYKLLNCNMMPVVSDVSREYTHTPWEMLAKYSRQMVLQNSINDEGLIWSIKPASETGSQHRKADINRVISSVVVARGSDKSVHEIEEKFSVPDMYRANRPRVLFGYSAHKFDRLERTVFGAVNAEKNGAFLEDLLSISWRKLNAKAFIYQYEKFGLDSNDIKDSFSVIEKVNKDYRNLHV